MERDQATRRAVRLDENLSAAYVLVLGRTSAGQGPVVPLPESGEAYVGREPPAELVVQDDSVSRRHARIIAGSPPEIEDLGSTNGTKVMGRLLRPGERAPIPFGTVIELGTLIAFVQPASTSANVDPTSNPLPPGPAETVARMTVAPPAFVPPSTANNVVVSDPTMRQLYDLIPIISPSRLSILILGETGVGKDVYAETVHARSPRAHASFVRLNCAALPENLLEAELFGYERGAFTGAHQAKPGLFEVAHGGTVFLDEIGELPLVTQAKLLRVLESGDVMRIGSVKPKRVDVRFISATNRDLEALSAMGQFRSDLFFRLNGVSVMLPPLRKRPDDVIPLATRFLELTGTGSVLTENAIARLRAHRWPGNIRELKNVVERAALLSRGAPVTPEHLLFGSSLLGGGPGVEPTPAPAPSAPQEAFAPTAPNAPRSEPELPRTGMPIRDEFAEIERTRILEAMERCGGNQSRAAKMLGISRTTLIKRLEVYQYVRPRKGQE